MDPGIDPILQLLLAIAIGFFVLLFLTALIMKIGAFARELDQINMEISRTTGRERQHWKRERCRLWLSLLPFYRR